MNDTVNCKSSSINTIGSSPSWIRPNDVMKSRKLKSRRHALKVRLNCSQPLHSVGYSKAVVDEDRKCVSSSLKRRNPFKCLRDKNIKISSENDDSENSTDSSLFQLFNSQPKPEAEYKSYSFSNLFPNCHSSTSVAQDTISEQSWSSVLNVDWSLKSRVRFYSLKPFQWKHTFKTSEEASGTTGFVRCLNSETEARDGRTLDTSANAQFYQCCLLWQHPSLPLITLFPRDKQKISAQTGIFGSDQKIVNSLHTEWSESLRSLYQLLRVRQCPFFYVCAHSFTCLFRAVGTAGFPHTHALITPTTRGFRDAMKREGVEFSMPLYDKSSQTEDENELFEEQENKNETILKETDGMEEEEPMVFLETLGLETSQFPSLNQNKVKTETKRFQGVDGLPQSLVYVEDMELQGLINFILNCGTCISTTGALAGVPPTLLSPVGFHGGTLKSLKISASTVRTSKGETQYSVDIQGPVLPTTVLHLSSLLSSTSDSYSVTLSPLTSTLPFCSVSPPAIGPSMPMAFANEGLVDCGLGAEIREILCKPANELRERGLPLSYREIRWENGRYTWTDKV